jgi:hypothetical protein
MNNQKEIYFHIGLERTGTTYLQHRFFPYLRGLEYLDKSYYKDDKYVQVIKSTDKNKFFVSHEFPPGTVKKELKKIAGAYPHAGIIITLRKHMSWLTSQYKRQLKKGKALDFPQYFSINNNQGEIQKDDLYYYPLVQKIEHLFTKKPLVLLYRTLKHTPHKYFNKICSYTGTSYPMRKINLTPKHTSYNNKQLILMRSIGSLLFDQNFSYSDHYLVRRFQKYLRMIPRYLILYGSLLIPNRFLRDTALIKPATKNKISRLFSADWEKCIKYINQSSSC